MANTHMCSAIFMCHTRPSYLAFFVCPVLLPNILRIAATRKKKKKHYVQQTHQILIQLPLFFLPEVLAEDTAGASKPSWQCCTERLQTSGRVTLANFSVWSGTVEKPAPTGCKTWEAEGGRERISIVLPHSINHILLCNFTLIHTRWSGNTV